MAEVIHQDSSLSLLSLLPLFPFPHRKFSQSPTTKKFKSCNNRFRKTPIMAEINDGMFF